MFNPSRFRLARRRRGFSKTRLAEGSGLELRTIYGYESGQWEPPPETLRRLADALTFPAEFFFGEDIDQPSAQAASFRSMSRMSAAKRDMALGAGAIAYLLNDWIERRFELPTVDVPDLRGPGPESAAAALRQHWGLGERPVRNMIHLLEAKGVRVFSLAEDSTDIDAFSLWRGSTPFMFLNTLKSAEHGRFDAGHELGHLVLHRHGAPSGQEAEREANAFASAFLMPRASVLAVSPGVSTVEHLVHLKKQWIVSVAALAYRLRTLGMISDWHYRTLCIEIQQRGYRQREPEGAQRESSQMLGKVFSTLRDEGVTKTDIARELSVPVDEIDRLIFGLILMGLSSGQSTAPRPIPRRPTLKLIE